MSLSHRPICTECMNPKMTGNKKNWVSFRISGADGGCPIEFTQWLINFTTFQFVLIWKNQKTINFENVWTLYVINGFRFRNSSWHSICVCKIHTHTHACYWYVVSIFGPMHRSHSVRISISTFLVGISLFITASVRFYTYSMAFLLRICDLQLWVSFSIPNVLMHLKLVNF